MTVPLDLKDVSLVAADTANMALTVRAFRLSLQQCNFKEAILFTHEKIEGPFRVIRIEKFKSRKDYQIFRLRQLPRLVDADFILSIEWDGCVLDARAWNPAFRDFDYIGAKWPFYSDGMTVGNSGFCLQSRKLLRALAQDPINYDGVSNVDDLICRTYRPKLEREHGIRFAPESIADQFSYENAPPDNPTFGFHGIGNMWRHTEDSEMIKLLEGMDRQVFKTHHYAGLVSYYYLQRKFPMLEAAYAKMRENLSANDALQTFQAILDSDARANEVFARCEQLFSKKTDRSRLKSSINQLR